MTIALRTAGLTKRWGAFAAASDVTLAFAEGARHALIGPNGAGKTTLVNLLTGALAPSSGDIYLGGENITGLPQNQRVKRGLARTFQVSALFDGLTVMESVMLAVCERSGAAWNGLLAPAGLQEETARARELLERLRLEGDAGRMTRELAYGKQRLLEIALALATGPRILLLDEPAAGIPAGESREVFSALADLPAATTVVFIEHDMDLVFRFAERITVLVGGRVLMEGTPDEVARDARVREVYLGEAQHG